MENNIFKEQQPIEETLEKNYLPYAMSVILSRALPEIDGLKPAHRKILYTMYKMGLLKGNKTKSANIVGQTMKLNPHGDASIYATLVRMAQGNESLLYPFIDSKGNFGKVYSKDMQYAASRYTEAKLSDLCRYIFEDIDRDTVDFEPNYDGTTYEPTLLPVQFPTILVNPNQGIAVGMASSICSFNLTEIINATIALMSKPKANLTKYIRGADFPTGGLIEDNPKVLEKMLEEGSGTFSIRGRWQYDAKNRCIEITEIPYTTTIESIMERIIKMIKDSEIKSISDVRDESDLKGLKIAIDLKRGQDPEEVIHYLFQKTTLEDTFSCNFNLIVNGYPTTTGVRGILLHWIDFRIGCYRRKVRFEMGKKRDQLHLITGLKRVLMDLDKVISLIRKTKKEKDVVPALMEAFLLDEVQAEYVANIRLRNINREYILNRVNDEVLLGNELTALQELYVDDELIKEKIKEELKEIKKKLEIGRKSEITSFTTLDFDEDEAISDEKVHLFITKELYLKKLTEAEFEKEQRLKEGDSIFQCLESMEKEELLIFTDQGNVYKFPVHQLEFSKSGSLGNFIPTISPMEKEEKIVKVFTTSDFQGELLFVYRDGKVAKVAFDQYETKTNRAKLVNGYSLAEPLVNIYWIKGNEYLIMERKAARGRNVLAVPVDKIPVTATRNSGGSRIFTMTKGSYIVKSKVTTSSMEAGPYLAKDIPSAGVKKGV